MNKRALKVLKRTFIYVSGLLHVLIKRPFYQVSAFLSKYGGEDFRHA